MADEYPVARQGSKVVMDLERYLRTGQGRAITRGVYEELTMHGGFIAHYDLNNFRRVFDGQPELLLRGELYPLASLPEPRSRYRYSDGLTSAEVLDGFRRLARAYGN